MATTDREKGCLYLVGAGPGDPGLLTLRGRDVLGRADVVLYDALANPRLLAFAPPEAERIDVGKRGGRHRLTQDEINELLVREAAAGKVVVRLKGGDPVLFGRGAEEAEAAAAHGIPFEFVPGVTSAIAAPIYAGIPVTHREHASSVTFVTGHEDPTKPESSLDWALLAGLVRRGGTLVILMGVRGLPAICRELLAHGLPPTTPAATVASGTLPEQRTVAAALAELPQAAAAAGLAAPAVTVIGPVVAAREALRWFDRRPLFGRRVVVTRTRDQASALSGQLRDLGADVIELPTIQIEPLPFEGDLRRAVENIDRYAWLVFTSPNGVTHFLAHFLDRWGDIRRLSGPQLAAIGPGTALKLRERNLSCDLVPDARYQQEGLLEAFARVCIRGKRVLLARAETARDLLVTGLQERGALVEVVPVYRTVHPPRAELTGPLAQLAAPGVDWITFTSSSTAEHFVTLLGSAGLQALGSDVRYASIGPVTSEAARRLGLPIAVEAARATIEDLVAAIVRSTP